MIPDNPRRVDVADERPCVSRLRNGDLLDAASADVNRRGSARSEVTWSSSTFEHVNLRQAGFSGIDFRRVKIDHSRLAGMRIDGKLVSEVLDGDRTVHEGDDRPAK